MKEDIQRRITPNLLMDFENYLKSEERSVNTVKKYAHDLRMFYVFLNGREFNRDTLLEWKKQLLENYASRSVNSMLAGINTFLKWMGLPQWKVKPLKIQHEIFLKPERELTKKEYFRLVESAKEGKDHQMMMLLQTLCATGIRISELQWVTVESIVRGSAEVNCKGKHRTVFFSPKLRKSLRCYCKECGIESGVIFRTKSGRPLDRSNIWKKMKLLCKQAGVKPEKVFPHNLRHLFARIHYQIEKDLSKLADILGHANVTTTRIYTMESGSGYAKQLDRMGLVPFLYEKTT